MTMTATDKVNRYSISVLWNTNEKVEAIKTLRTISGNNLSACKRALESVYGEFAIGTAEQRPLVTDLYLMDLSDKEQEKWDAEKREEFIGIAMYRALRIWTQDSDPTANYDDQGNYDPIYGTDAMLDLAQQMLNIYKENNK